MLDEHGNEHVIEIENPTQIGLGGNSAAYAADIFVDGTFDDSLCIRRFDRESSQSDTFDIWIACKKAQMRVLPMCYSQKDGYLQVITNADSKEWISVDCNSKNQNEGKMNQFPEGLIGKIANLEDVLRNYYQEAILATEKNIALTDDVLWFLIQRNRHDTGDFVLGDLGCVSIKKGDADKNLRMENVGKLDAALQSLMHRYFTDGADRYAEIFNGVYRDFCLEHDVWYR